MPTTHLTALRVVVALLVLGAVGHVVFTAWEPPYDGSIDYSEVVDVGAAYWPMNLYLGGPAFAVWFVCLAVLTSFLARGRSAAVSLAASVLLGLAGILFALVVTAEVLPFAWAADPEVLPAETGREVVAAYDAHLGSLAAPIVGTQVAIALGVVGVLVTGLVTRALPRFLAVLGLVYAVAFFALPPRLLAGPVGTLSHVLQTAILLAVGWHGYRVAVTREPAVTTVPVG